jgi:hypothetical protein
VPIFIDCGAPKKFIDFLGSRVDAAQALLRSSQVQKTDVRPYPSRPSRRATNESEPQMSERLLTLKKARERMTEDRDAFAKTLAAPFDRDKAERARTKFIETQMLIDAIDRAIAGERGMDADVALATAIG